MMNSKESRKQKNKKVARVINKIFGGLDCGTYNTQKERKDCNIILRNKLLSDKPLQCNLISDSIQLNRDITINFEKLIGNGQFGKAYLSSISPRKYTTYQFIIKEQTITNGNPIIQIQNELIIAKYLSMLVERNISPHFLYFYTEVPCENTKIIGGNEIEKKRRIKPLLDMSLITKNEEKRYFIVEKATGTLSSLKNSLKYNFKNIITQIILSIFTFHQYTKCYHLDTHHDNFLLHEFKNEKNMYMKYKLNNNIYRLNISKYLIILWDYGIAKTMNNTSFLYYNISIQNIYWTKLIYDYYRIISIICDDRYYEKNIEHYKILKNLILILNEYNQKIKYKLNNLRDMSKELQIQTILQIEKELLYRLIQEKIIFNNKNISNLSYNNVPYDLDNNQNIHMNPIIQENTSILNEKFDGVMSNYDFNLIQKLKKIS